MLTGEAVKAEVRRLEDLLQEERVRALEPQWLRLLREGVVVRLHIGRPTFQVSLSPALLGLRLTPEEEEAWREAVNPGRLYTVPRRYITRLAGLENRGREALQRWGFRTYWGTFVPVSAYFAWREEDRALREEYLETGRALAEEWGAVLAEMRGHWERMARYAYDRLLAQGQDLPPQEEWVEETVRRLEEAVPSPERIREGVYWEAELFYVPLPSILEEDLARAERVRQEEEARLRVAQEQYEAELARWRAERERQMAREDYWATRRRLMEEMHREVVEKARREKERVLKSFVQEVEGRLRGLVYDAAEAVLDALRNGNALPPRTKYLLRRTVDALERLNILEDREVQQVCALLRRFAKGTPSREEVEEAFRAIAVWARASLLALGRGVRDLPDLPPPRTTDLERARRSLGLLPEPEQVSLERAGRVL